MSTITKIEIWDSPGFLEESVEVPKLGASISTPSRTYSGNYRPSVDRLLSELKIPDDYSNLRNATYLRVTLDMNNGTDQTFYGWVDSVEISSDTSTYAMTTVRWHVDLWRTYSGSASFGSGHVRRKPTGSHPLQGYDRIRRIVSSTEELVPNLTYGSGQDRVWWAILAYTRTSRTPGSTDKIIEYACWPITRSSFLYIGVGSGYQSISTKATFSSAWDEVLEIDPNSVVGGWLSPVPPFVVSGSGTQADPYKTTATTAWNIEAKVVDGQNVNARFYTNNPGDWGLSSEITVSKTASSTERAQLCVTGFDGEPLQEIPVGASLASYSYRVVLGPATCSIEIRFDGLSSRAEGLCCNVPCVSLDLSENAWSSYVFSGQRDFDANSRMLQTMQGGVLSATGGALNGAVIGGFGKLGAAAGAGLALGGAAISTALDAAIFNPAIQENLDAYTQRQSAGILLNGAAWDMYRHGRTICMISLAFDTYSEAQASARDSQFGFSVDEFHTSLASDLTSASTGFWQIDSLVVGGSIPAEAKRYISRRFAAGVRLT